MTRGLYVPEEAPGPRLRRNTRYVLRRLRSTMLRMATRQLAASLGGEGARVVRGRRNASSSGRPLRSRAQSNRGCGGHEKNDLRHDQWDARRDAAVRRGAQDADAEHRTEEHNDEPQSQTNSLDGQEAHNDYDGTGQRKCAEANAGDRRTNRAREHDSARRRLRRSVEQEFFADEPKDHGHGQQYTATDPACDTAPTSARRILGALLRLRGVPATLRSPAGNLLIHGASPVKTCSPDSHPDRGTSWRGGPTAASWVR